MKMIIENNISRHFLLVQGGLVCLDLTHSHDLSIVNNGR